MSDTTRALIAAESLEGKNLAEVLKNVSGLEVAAVIRDYDRVLDAVLNTKPSVIVIDFQTSPQAALETVRKVMAEAPTPIIVLFSAQEDVKKMSDIISAGALTVAKKPDSIDWKTHPDALRELIEGIRIYSKIKVIRHVAARRQKKVEAWVEKTGDSKIVAIASSTGGPQALKEILSRLPADFPATTLIVQHITKGFTKGLVEWLDQECSLPVREPVDGERVPPGVVLIAPEDCHMMVTRGSHIKLERSEPVGGHRPSANVLLSSVAKIYGSKAIGVVLTGMGSDGAKGLKAIKEYGGETITQDEKSSAVYGMPQAAVKSGAADKILPLDKIADEIDKMVKRTYWRK